MRFRFLRPALRRKIAAFWRGLPRCLLFLPLYLVLPVVYGIDWLLTVTCQTEKRGKIRIITLSEDREKRFATVTCAALALVEKHDAARYARLQKELRWITDDHTPVGAASYDRNVRECKVNFDNPRFDWAKLPSPQFAEHYDWYLADYAALLVHEATHGYLFSRGFPYTKETRLRCERICVAAANRFLARLPHDKYNFACDLARPFDASEWDYSWNTPRSQQLKDLYHRTIDIVKN